MDAEETEQESGLYEYLELYECSNCHDRFHRSQLSRVKSFLKYFEVVHWSHKDQPELIGNGFDGLPIGRNQAEAEEFIHLVNILIENEIKGQQVKNAK
ncbi:MAG: hypothetical protein WC734_06040 [Patescibacteria group bacterium]|jgi:hypothetical protein